MVNTSGNRMDVSTASRSSLLISPPAFPLHVFPPWIAVLCELIARTLGTSVNLVATAMLGIISAVIVGRIGVILKNGFYIPSQIYTCIVGRPGAAKGGIIDKLSRCLYEHYDNRNKAINIDNAIIRKKLSNIKSQLDDLDTDDNKMRNLLDQQNAIMMRPEYEEFLTNVTPESLTSCLSKQAGNGVILSTEPTILAQLTKQTGPNGGYENLETLLKGFGGESINLTRLCRSGEKMKSANLSILIGIQTHLAASFVRDENLKGTGLTARFIFGYDPHDIIARENVGDCSDLLKEWNKLIIGLSDIYRPTIGTAYIEPMRVTCDDDADSFIKALNNRNRLSSSTTLADEDSFVSKTDQFIAKLSLLCKLMYDPTAKKLTIEDVMRGSDLFDYCLGTLRALEGASTLGKAEMSLLRAIMEIAKSTDNGIFPQMNPYRKIKGQEIFSGNAGMKNYQQALQHLHELGYIQRIEKTNTSGGPNTQWFQLAVPAEEIESK